ncbi:hypothetical protein TNCT_282901 [Trichonephila clavata]|uniref:Single domain-containing protein n=1 Tax=Trichonephila clavata TaxID=2740835 RepID=A0A8X6M4A7_TRICU|nr:hypothetical protein TNCT_282901 [Trichonephila clavata]
MHRLLAVSCILVFVLGLPEINGYTYTEYLNTKNGYCESEGSYKTPVGETGYDDQECERFECRRGYRTVAGCGKVVKPTFPDHPNPICSLVKGEGHYPDCCPSYKCHFNEEE